MNSFVLLGTSKFIASGIRYEFYCYRKIEDVISSEGYAHKFQLKAFDDMMK